MPTHQLEQDRPQSASLEECTLKTRPTHSLKQDGPVSVTRRVHIENLANSLSVKEWPEKVSSEECIVKRMVTHHLKNMAKVCVLEVCKINAKKHTS